RRASPSCVAAVERWRVAWALQLEAVQDAAPLAALLLEGSDPALARRDAALAETALPLELLVALDESTAPASLAAPHADESPSSPRFRVLPSSPRAPRDTSAWLLPPA